MGYILSSRPDSAAQQGPVSKQAKTKRKLQFPVLASQLWWCCLCTMPSAGSVRWTDSCTRGQATWARLLCSVTLPVSTLIPTWPHTSQLAPGDFVRALRNAYLPESHWTIENSVSTRTKDENLQKVEIVDGFKVKDFRLKGIFHIQQLECRWQFKVLLEGLLGIVVRLGSNA